MVCYNCNTGSCGQYRPSWANSAWIEEAYLPLPAFVPSTISHPCYSNVCSQVAPVWAHFCDPPKAAYPVSAPPFQIDINREPVGGNYYGASGAVGIAPPSVYNLDRGFAIACRIVPTSKCLPFIMFHGAMSLSTANNITVEIRANDPATNLPVGQPGDNNILGRVASPFYQLVGYSNNGWGDGSTVPYHLAVPINTILDEIDVPVWIILYSDDYACSDAFVGSAHRRLQLAQSSIGTNNVAIFNQANGCKWAIDTTINGIAITTYKAQACNGTVVVNDYAFARLGEPPIYLNDNCFVRLAEVEGANVAIGVKYTNPDPIRAWRRVRFSFAYRKPDLRYFTAIADLFNVTPGQHETFFDMSDLFFTGDYDELFVSAAVIQV